MRIPARPWTIFQTRVQHFELSVAYRCCGEADTVARSNVEPVEHVYQGYRRRDSAEIFQLCAPDIEIVQTRELSWSGEFHRAPAAMGAGEL